ncbi:MAG: DALR anticodon-binding domain-containing protein, partial [Pseudomonadota bacterium]|nr:DALR anticodon-binding domain-containing protein [Pseudomonadota bacterium]
RTAIEGALEFDLIRCLQDARFFARTATRIPIANVHVALAEIRHAAANSSYDFHESELEEPLGLKPGEVGELLDTTVIQDFITDRLRSYYADQSTPMQQFEAVAAFAPSSLLNFDRRLKAIGEFAKLPEAQALAAANKRIRNILRKVEGDLPTAVDPARFIEDAERELADVVDAAIADTDPLLAQRDYVAVLGRLARLRPQVDAFFDAVMVNVDDAAVRNNRLALLKRLSDRLGSVAAIEHLSV